MYSVPLIITQMKHRASATQENYIFTKSNANKHHKRRLPGAVFLIREADSHMTSFHARFHIETGS